MGLFKDPTNIAYWRAAITASQNTSIQTPAEVLDLLKSSKRILQWIIWYSMTDTQQI